MNEVTFSIDGRELSAAAGTTVLEAALQNDIYIPHLCHHPDLDPAGVCRLCLVHLEGRGLAISCRTPVEPGLLVSTEHPQVDQARRATLELILANHPPDCLGCARNTRCELQRAAAYIGVDPERLKRLRRNAPARPIDRSNPFFELDHNKCVLCGICARTCDELQGIGAIDFAFRGFDAAISTFAGQPLINSRCVSCGECVVRCPVGALAPKKARQPAREVKSVCPYCGVGCGIYLGVRGNQVVGVRGDRQSPVNRGSLCVKGRFGWEFIHSPDRLQRPLVRKNGSFAPATWDEALDLVADRLGRIKALHGPGALGVLSSARCSNEENYLLQKFTRAVLGTNNIDHCARL
jgi:formate dehydrogenase major subunit